MQNQQDDRPKVAHVLRGYLATTETFIGNQIVSLREFQPIVLCHYRVNGHSYPVPNLVSVDELLPLHLRVVDSIAYKARLLSPAAARALARSVLQQKAQLIHFHYLVDARFFLELKRITGLPAMVSAYGYDVSSFPRKYGGYGRRYLRPLFDEIELFVAMSPDMRHDLIRLGCPDERIAVHYYGTDTRRFAYPERKHVDEDEIEILACGTLESKKAQHLTLEALRSADRRGMLKRRFRITFVGDGPMRSRLQRQVAKYGWQDRVTFMGHVPHHEEALVDTYRRADVFSLPSITVKGDKEGIPGTIIEAMASGLPIVSSYHAGIPAVIESGKEGILVEEGNVEAMAQAFAELIENRDLREQLGRAAASRATGELDLQQRTTNLERLYRELLEGEYS